MAEITQDSVDMAFVLCSQTLVDKIQNFWKDVGNQPPEKQEEHMQTIFSIIDTVDEMRKNTRVFKSYIDADLLDKEYVRNFIKWHVARR